MSSNILKGAPVAEAIDERTISRVIELKKRNIEPCLAILRVGNDDGAMSYEKGAVKRCEKLGIKVKPVYFDYDVNQEKLEKAILDLNKDSSVHGVLIFRPLPKMVDEIEICDMLDARKDVDGITRNSLAKVYSGSGYGFDPCTAESCLQILKHYGISVSGKKVAVVGRSLVIGRPVAMMLMRNNATVTICHSRTENLEQTVKEADIVIACIGKAHMLGESYFSEGQTVIDVGINYSEQLGKIVGDVDTELVSEKVLNLTPVPGGVGSVTTSVLLSHVVEAAENSI